LHISNTKFFAYGSRKNNVGHEEGKS